MQTPKFGAGSILENYMEIFIAKNSTESLKQVDYVNIARFKISVICRIFELRLKIRFYKWHSRRILESPKISYIPS